MTATDRAAALELARSHIAGHEADMRQYPDCVRCHTTMDSDSEPSAFCADCIYVVTDALSEQLLAAEAERESLAAEASVEFSFTQRLVRVVEAAVMWREIGPEGEAQFYSHMLRRIDEYIAWHATATTDTERHDG